MSSDGGQLSSSQTEEKGSACQSASAIVFYDCLVPEKVSVIGRATELKARLQLGSRRPPQTRACTKLPLKYAEASPPTALDPQQRL